MKPEGNSLGLDVKDDVSWSLKHYADIDWSDPEEATYMIKVSERHAKVDGMKGRLRHQGCLLLAEVADGEYR